jgi:putative transposase
MDNHVHLIAIPHSKDSLARGIGEAHRRYTCWVNHGDGVTGYLFQGRFYSCPLDERHLMAAARYAERNPVRAGLVSKAWDYKWSSAAFHVGLRAKDPLVKDLSILGLAGDWREMLLWDPEEMPTLRKLTRTGRPCGDSGFLEAAEGLTQRRLRPKPMGRPYGKRKSGT